MNGTTLAEEATPPSTTLRAGDVVDYRYELLSELRSGGMGVVWRGRDLELERDVTVREMRFPAILDPAAQEILANRLAAESRTLAAVTHPGVVRVLAVVESGAAPLVVSEEANGPTLAQRVAGGGPARPEDVTRIGEDVAEALAAAADAGVHHRFLRPDHIIVPDEGPARVCEFGVAALIGDSDVEGSGAVGPSAAAYLAPEHRRTPSGSTAADVWSLGATLYFAVEGRPPFEAGSTKATLDAVATARHEPALRAEALGPVLDGLLAKSPLDRPELGDVPAIMKAAAAMLTGPPLDTSELMFWRDPLTPPLDLMPQPVPPGTKPPPRPVDPKAHRRKILTLLAALGVIGLLATLITAGGRGPARTDDNRPPQWVNYIDDDTGFQISYPPGWEVVREGTNTDFREPQTDTAIRVGFQRSPSVSPEQVWLDLEARFKVENPSYQRIRLEPAVFAGFDAAAWEFTWTDRRGQDLHNEDLAFNAGGYAFALNFQSTAANWETHKILFDRFVSSFRPPS